MKILQLSKKFPYPLKDGESLAISYLSKAYHRLGAEVTLLAMNTTKHPFAVNDLPPEYDQYASIYSVPVDNRIKVVPALSSLLGGGSYHISRFQSEAYAQRLGDLLRKQSFDLIQLETVYLAPYIPLIRKLTQAPVVMRAHNVEFEIWDRITQNTRSPWKRWYLRILTRRLKRYEVDQLGTYDLLLAITRRDLDRFQTLGFRGAALHVPIGLDLDRYHPNWSSYENPLSIGFIGSLDWMPNLEGITWFLEKVWPQLETTFPQLEIHIAGRNTTQEFRRKFSGPRVIIHGEVEDARAFINTHTMMVVPLLSGSGMRAKILEGMALGKAVLTTRLGLEGITARHQETVLKADTPQEFQEAIRWSLEHPDQLKQLGEKARTLAEERYDNQQIAAEVLDRFADLLHPDQKAIPKDRAWGAS